MKQRLTAFGLHLVISATASGILLLILVKRWYPAPYFWVDGGWQGLRLVMAVDIVIGPLLTAMVFSKRKGLRKLYFDLTVIGVLQVSAMALGVWTVYLQRTALVLFTDGTFYTLDPDTVTAVGSPAIDLVARSTTRPVVGVLRLPEGAELQKWRVEALRSRRPLYLHGEVLEGLEASNFNLVQARELNLDRWQKERAGREEVVSKLRREFSQGLDDYVVVPGHARFGSLLLVFRRNTGELVWALDSSPVG